jgi:hypothetical protein
VVLVPVGDEQCARACRERRSAASAYSATGADIAAERVAEARKEADKVYMQKEKKRRREWEASQAKMQKAKKTKKTKPPALRVPAKWRCRKEEKCPPKGTKKCFPDEKLRDLESLSYKCTFLLSFGRVGA